MELDRTERWNIKLKVTPQERKKIQKQAIDLDMRIADYVKFKLLENDSTQKDFIEKKSA